MSNPINTNEAACPFCQLIKAGKLVERLGSVAAVRDGFPVTDGHMLIIPLRHAADWFTMTDEELADARDLVRRLAEKIRRDDPLVTGFNIGANAGQSAGQTVFHAHIHLIPRRDGDCDNPRGGVRGVIDGKRSY